MNNLLKKIDNYLFYIALFAIALFSFMLPYYAGGRVVLGGEGSYFLNFKILQENLNYAWQNLGVGFPSTSLNFTYFNVAFYALFQKIFPDIQAVNFIFIYVIYFLPFFAVFMSCRELKLPPFKSFLTAYFYIINPFSLYFMTSINQWNSLSLFVMPFFFWIILKFYKSNGLLFLFFGLGSSLFAFTNANPPLMIINHLSAIISLIFVSIYFRSSFSILEVILKYTVILSSFILFNLWWILNWISVMSDIPKLYTQDFAMTWASLVNNFPNLIWKSFAFTNMIPVDPTEHFLSTFYNSSFSFFIVLIPISIVLYYFYKQKQLFINPLVRFLFPLMLLIIFLIKGPAEPFGFIYKLMMMYIPLFSVFKSPIEKWSVLYLFLFTLLFIIILKDMRGGKTDKFIYIFFIIYLLFCSIPFATSNFIPDYKMGDGHISSRSYFDKAEYKNLRQEINNDPSDYRVLSLPGSLNYQVALFMDEDKFYTGMDPVLSNINKQFIAPYSVSLLADFNMLFDNISIEHYSRLLSLYNVGKVVINKDMYPWFGFREKEGFKELEEIFDKTMEGKKDSLISVYNNNDNLPHIYAASENTIVSSSNSKAILPLISADMLTDYPALAFTEYQDKENLWPLFENKQVELSGEKKGQIIFVNSSVSDLITELSKKEALSHNAKSEIGSILAEKQNKYEKLIQTRDFKYLFYIDKNEADKIISSAKASDTISSIKNPYYLNTKQFYIPEDGSYEVKAHLKPKRTFLPDEGTPMKSIGSTGVTSPVVQDAVSGWEVTQNSTDPEKQAALIMKSDGLHVTPYFEKGVGFREAVILTKDFSGINIRENRYLRLSQITKKNIQVVEVEVWFKDKKGELLPQKIVFIPDTPVHGINLYDNARKIFKKNIDNLYVGRVQIIFSKNEEFDATAEGIKGRYEFIFKNFEFLSFEPMNIEIEDSLKDFSTDRYYYYNREGGLEEAVLWEEIPQHVEEIYKLEQTNYIDITDRTAFELKFNKPRLQNGKNLLTFPAKLKISLFIDFDGDKKEDTIMDILYPASPRGGADFSYPDPKKPGRWSTYKIQHGEKLHMNLPVYEEVKKQFPDQNRYILLGLTVSHPDNKDTFWNTVFDKKLYTYKKHIYKASDFNRDNDIFNIDKKPFQLQGVSQYDEKERSLTVTFNSINLNKGDHQIDFFDNKEFYVDMLEISRVKDSKAIPKVTPKIAFKKINPSRYVVDVGGAKEAFTLVFSESFHNNWKAYMKQDTGKNSNESWSTLLSEWKDKDKSTEIKDHFVVNGYANGWIVPANNVSKGSDQNNLQIVLEYKPQRSFEIGMLIYMATFLSCVICIGYGFIKKCKR